MSREDRQRRVREQREAGGETFSDVLRRLARHPALLIKVSLVAVICAAIGVAVLKPPFQALVLLIAVPWTAWLVRRGR